MANRSYQCLNVILPRLVITTYYKYTDLGVSKDSKLNRQRKGEFMKTCNLIDFVAKTCSSIIYLVVRMVG